MKEAEVDFRVCDGLPRFSCFLFCPSSVEVVLK